MSLRWCSQWPCYECRFISGPHICGDALDLDIDNNQLVTGSWRKKDALEASHCCLLASSLVVLRQSPSVSPVASDFELWSWRLRSPPLQLGLWGVLLCPMQLVQGCSAAAQGYGLPGHYCVFHFYGRDAAQMSSVVSELEMPLMFEKCLDTKNFCAAWEQCIMLYSLQSIGLLLVKKVH